MKAQTIIAVIILILLAAVAVWLVMRTQQQPVKLVPAQQTQKQQAPTFDTNDHLDDALQELDALGE